MTMSKNPTFVVTYTGEGVVSLARVGRFQTGTMAVVGAEEAEAARAQGHFQVRRYGEPGESEILPPPAPAIPSVPPPPSISLGSLASPGPPEVRDIVDAAPPAPPVVSEPPVSMTEPTAATTEPTADASPVALAGDMDTAAALGGDTPAPEPAGDSHETHDAHDDGEASAHPEESGGEGAPPRRKPRRR